MSDFLQFVLKNGTESSVTHDDVVRWAGALDNRAFYNAAALDIARHYHEGLLTYGFCDRVMNDLWSAMQAGFTNDNDPVPEPFFQIYEAFDAGEYHRAKDKSDDPIADFTDPLIANLLSRFSP